MELQQLIRRYKDGQRVKLVAAQLTTAVVVRSMLTDAELLGEARQTHLIK